MGEESRSGGREGPVIYISAGSAVDLWLCIYFMSEISKPIP